MYFPQIVVIRYKLYGKAEIRASIVPVVAKLLQEINTNSCRIR